MDITLIIFLISILIASAVMHEVAHGAMAYALGDPTAKMHGRLTLNPLVHLDPVGSILLPALMVITQVPFFFAYAKPVPYNPYNLKYPRWGESLVAVAGPASNIILAVCLGFIFQIGQYLGLISISQFGVLFLYAISVNMFLALFNLIPIPPLDGSKVIRPLLPYHLVRSVNYVRLERNGNIILLLFIFAGGGRLLIPLVSGATNFIMGL